MDYLSLYVFTFFAFLGFVYTQDPSVSSKLGDIIGKTTILPFDKLPYKNVHEYLGIPFAEPPTGERRFRKPEPKTYLGSSFYAQSHGAACPQTASTNEGFEQNENCLFLNVYVPERPADEASGHAVIIWIYGGGFQQGAANSYDGALMALTGNVIVVTINYRVGAFGFLSTGDDNAPGNFGLWDQHLAIQWVHDYIGDFGGGNQRVTIAGESAGAMSVIQQALTPDNHGLFQRIIAQSGSMSVTAYDLERDGMKDTLVLADRLGCPTSMDELMDCLREKSVDEYLTSLKELNMTETETFVPIVDDSFIKVNPQHISKISEIRTLEEVEFFRSLDILTGFNAYEGASMLGYFVDPNQIETWKPTREEMQMYLPILLQIIYRREFKDELMKVVEAQYTNWTNPDHYESIRLQITKLAGDGIFVVPALEMADLHKKSSASRNYMYNFTPLPSVRAMPTASWVPGANHADDLLFMFGGIGVLGVGEDNAWEVELITKMMTYWTNFVKSGDPNSPEPISPFWPEYTVDTGDHIVLEKSMSDASAKQYLYAKEFNFWMSVFPDLVEAMEGKGKGDWCDDHTSAAANLNFAFAKVIVPVMIMSLFSIF